MLTFQYTALDQDGLPQKGVITASDQTQAADFLRERKLIITSLKARRKLALSASLAHLRGVPLNEKIIFTRQLATMISSGLPITQALQILKDQSRSEIFKKALGEIIADIDGGANLKDALGKHPEVFDRLYLSLVEAGEASGKLDEILLKLATQLEGEAEFKAKTKGALIYPAVIVVVMFLVLGVMFVFVIPQLKGLYEEMGAELPATTRFLLSASTLFTTRWWLGLILLIVFIFAYRYFVSTIQGRYVMDNLKFKLPVLGKLTKEIQLANFTRTLALLTTAGIPILRALDISQETVSNINLKEGVAQAAQSVEKGKPLAEPLRQNSAFPAILAEMVSVGEQTGKVDETLAKVAVYFEGEAENSTRNLASAMEPVIMVVLGGLVGFLVISLILPIYSLTSQF